VEQAAGWYPDPECEGASTAQLRYWNGGAWTTNFADPGKLSVDPSTERIEPWALLMSVLPLIGIVGGGIAMLKGKRRNGRLMMMIGFGTFLVLAIVSGRGS
jgi:hypothetical protein